MIKKRREIKKLYEIGYFCDKCNEPLQLVPSSITLTGDANNNVRSLVWQCPVCYTTTPITEDCLPNNQEIEFAEWEDLTENKESSLVI